uniref:Uncharacterized protein n=1 Tax=Pyricularia oryzae TaxID=318829 RepID=A0A1S5QK00_PYROR|nr:hypothetical protein [Pyricularia oryzae]
MAKFRLRGVSFSCSLIVVAVMSTVLTMFDAAKRNSNDNKDMWGWSCAQTPRAETFEDDVDYSLLCRLQVGIGIISRKQVPQKSMGAHNDARERFYLAQGPSIYKSPYHRLKLRYSAVMRIVDAIVLRTVQNSAATLTVAVPIPAPYRPAAV